MAAFVHADVFIDGPITGALIDYPVPNVVADKAAPPVSVMEDSGLVPALLRVDSMEGTDRPLAAGVPVPFSTFGVSSVTYRCEYRGDAQRIARETLRQAAARGSRTLLDIEAAAAATSKAKLLRAKEAAFAAAVFGTSTWTNTVTLTGTDQWSDTASRPLKNIKDAIEAIAQAVGIRPNSMIISGVVMAALSNHPSMSGISSDGAQKSLAPEDIAKMTGLPNVYVADASRRTSNEGATVTTADIYGDNCLIFYQSPRSIMGPCAIGHLEYQPLSVRKWDEIPGAGGGAEVIETTLSYDFVVCENLAGYMYADVLA